ncbi:MAG: hypothetical protein PHY14_00580 [Candidatus Gracilibacteria bacterium]|nr:hypothetical protein [Candidatus Gracilibacteria bacterium]
MFIQTHKITHMYQSINLGISGSRYHHDILAKLPVIEQPNRPSMRGDMGNIQEVIDRCEAVHAWCLANPGKDLKF